MEKTIEPQESLNDWNAKIRQQILIPSMTVPENEDKRTKERDKRRVELRTKLHMRALEEEVEESEERSKIAQKEVENRIHEANERQIEQTQSTNALMEQMVLFQ